MKKSDLVQLDHLEGNPTKEQVGAVAQPAFLRQLLSYVVFLFVLC